MAANRGRGRSGSAEGYANAPSPTSSQGVGSMRLGGDNVRKEDWDRHVSELHGKMNQNRSQINELHKKLQRIPGMDMDNILQPMQRDLQQLKAQAAQSGQLQQETAMLRNELAQLKTEMAQSSQLRNEIAQAKRDMERFKQELAQATQLRSDVEKCKSEMSQVSQLKNELNQMKNELSQTTNLKNDMNKVKDEAKQAVRAAKELSSMKDEVSRSKKDMESKIREASQKHQKMEQEMRETKTKTREVDTVKMEAGRTTISARETARDLADLKKTLNDLGVLKPPKVEVAADEPPPVGTIELAEDCFTARLLIRLMFLKAKAEGMFPLGGSAAADDEDDAGEEADSRGTKLASIRDLILTESDSDDSGDTKAAELGMVTLLENLENVHGIGDPEVEVGAKGYRAVTMGWGAVCVGTMFVQLMIICILLMYAQKPTECFAKPPSSMEWWILHVSKAAAILVAGMLMAKDFMDIVNGQMVSMIVEPSVSIEIFLTNFIRFVLSASIAIADVFMFVGLTSPLDVWINMTAMCFVAELGMAMNDQAKKGVFGHDIRAQLTAVNYELTFVTTIPCWIPYVQAITLLIVASFIGFCSYYVFVTPDCMCDAACGDGM